MESPVLSIYIPVYNAEKVLDQCLSSVVNQTMSSLEIYLYNDGSTDRSAEICQKYAENDPRIIFYSGANGNSVKNTNKFLNKARGKYIGFVDNDDYLDPDYFEKMIRMLEEKDADCVISSYTLVDSEGNVLPWYTPGLENGLVLTREEALRRFLTTLDIEGFRWNKIYKTAVFRDNHISFPKLIPGDINGEWILLSHIGKAVLLANKGYYYRQSATSQMGSLSLSRLSLFMETFDRMAKNADAVGLKTEGEYYRVWRRINTMFNTWKGRKKITDEEWAAFLSECSWKKTVKYSLKDALRIIYSYKNAKEPAWRFTIKTIVVWLAYR